MRASSVLFLAGSIAHAAAQDIEPADFDVTTALLDLGINVTEIPQLSDFVERRSLSDIACAAAVSPSISLLIVPWIVPSPQPSILISSTQPARGALES
jgi:hypothetical protein